MSNAAFEAAIQAQREHQDSNCRQCYGDRNPRLYDDPRQYALCPTGQRLLDAVTRAMYASAED